MVQRHDGRMQVERYAALQLALGEFAAVFGDAAQFDDARLRLLERRAGLQDLRFETEPVKDAAREMQSLHNRNGRILGWFSWAPDRALIRAMYTLWELAAAIAAALTAFAVLSALAAKRLAATLAQSERTVHRLTSEDALTGLPNQRVLTEALGRVLTRRAARFVAFAAVDLDSFREVNDTLGRAGGDSMFARIAERLNTGVPQGALCARNEDDEFAVMLTGEGPDTADRLAAALRAALARPIFMNQMWQIGASIGLAQAPDDGTSAEELTRRAGLALRAAKREGRGLTMRFAPAIETEHYEGRYILRELKSAVAAQALDVHYQPVVAADGAGILGVEALLRWTHAVRGAIPPSVFISLAEQNGLMPELGAFVLRRALADAVRWPRLFVSVNLSPVQMRDRAIVDLVGAIMAENAIASSRLVLEVTESVLIDDPHDAMRRLEALRALGVRLALDDFGAGYSSLNYLQQFPFDRLKIDRAFVAPLGRSGNAGAIVQSIVTLGHALGMKVLAEGVETDEQRVLLRLAGCDEMQGYLFARPAPADVIDTLVAPGAPARLAAAH
jgi:diguanylate cyclase (GGDEF)-like protein